MFSYIMVAQYIDVRCGKSMESSDDPSRFDVEGVAALLIFWENRK